MLLYGIASFASFALVNKRIVYCKGIYMYIQLDRLYRDILSDNMIS